MQQGEVFKRRNVKIYLICLVGVGSGIVEGCEAVVKVEKAVVEVAGDGVGMRKAIVELEKAVVEFATELSV